MGAIVTQMAEPAGLAVYSDAARDLARASVSPNTRRAYGSAWGSFLRWCESRDVAALPAGVPAIVDYLAELAGVAGVSTVRLHVAAIAWSHQAAGLESPTTHPDVHTLMRGIVRTKGTRPDKAHAVTVDELRAIVQACPSTLAGRRDRALILLGFWGAFRRSELCALDVSDLQFGAELVVTLRRSKTDQAGVGIDVPIPRLVDVDLDPFQAVRAWIDGAGVDAGRVFRAVDRWDKVRGAGLNDRAVSVLLKAAASRAGFDASIVDAISGHSLRRGFATSADGAGCELRDIMAVTRHKSVQVAMGYTDAGRRAAERAIKRVAGE